MSMTLRSRRSWLWHSVVSISLLTPGSWMGAFQQGSPAVTRESLNRNTVDVEMLAEEQFRLGLAYLKSPQSTEKAVEHLEKAVELNGINPEFHFKLAEAYAKDFSYANVLRKPFLATKMKNQLELAVRFDPRSIEYREGLIQYYLSAPAVLGGSFEKAREQAEAMRAIDPYFSLLAHANINAEEGDHRKANAFYIRAIQLRRDGWQAYQQYGSYCLSIQEVDRAIQQFQNYVKYAPDTAQSYEALAGAYVRKRMYDEAIKEYQKAIEIDQSLSHLIFRIAQLYEFKGSTKTAAEYYEQYVTVSPNGRLANDARTKIAELKR